MPSSPSRLDDGPGRASGLTATPFAHRGLHGKGLIENSRAAFEAALAEGHGIELDVQASRDGDAFVFHDYDLARLTGEQGEVAARASEALGRITLTGSDETIPTLPEILTLIAGRGPLLIELKAPDHRVVALCRSVAAALNHYAGPVGVMSFNPQVGHWFAAHAPQIVRGLVISESGKTGLRGRIERELGVWRAKPDFLAYNIADLPSSFAVRQRARGRAMMTWTVRNALERERAAVYADQIIYEGPSKRR